MKMVRHWIQRSLARGGSIGLLACLLAVFGVFPLTIAAGALREFAYRQMTLSVVGLDGKPVAEASVYGFCRELNLVWPRQDKELRGRDYHIWHESFLGKTDSSGSVKVVVPPGKWGFFAAGRAGGARNSLVMAWTDFQERVSGERIRLAPVASRQWSLCAREGTALRAKQVLVKPEGFPIWIPLTLAPAANSLALEINRGPLGLWAAGDATSSQPGFVLSWGTVSNQTADGRLLAPEKAAVIQCQGGGGRASLTWFRKGNLGLEGEVALTDVAKVLMHPGVFALSYRRPVTGTMMGEFVGQSYKLEAEGPRTFNFDTLLAAGVDNELWEPRKTGDARLSVRLYLVDGNGHPLAELFDAAGHPAKFGASVWLGGKRFPARQLVSESGDPTTGEGGQTMFEANVGAAGSDASAAWEFAAPPGILRQARVAEDERITVASETFKIDVPKVLARHASNVLAQAEGLVDEMENVSGRKRRRSVTTISIKPGRSGAGASHSGAYIGIGTKLFFSDRPMLRHDFVHELAHNFNLTHGGLHELVVETTRCVGGDQVSQQPAKWMFMDRMNGLTRKEVLYRNTGLYLACYARGGTPFSRFLLTNEAPVRDQLRKLGFKDDEILTALCSLALQRDLTPVCAAYGLAVNQTRAGLASQAARPMCQRP